MKSFHNLLALLPVVFCSAFVFASEPEEAFNGYLAALMEGRYDDAETYWQPELIAQSKSLGITFKDTPVKYDCASPIITFLDPIREGIVGVNVTNVENSNEWAKLEIELSSISDTLTTQYYAAKNNDIWRLTSPVYLFTKDWKEIETRFAHIYYSDSSRINRVAIDAMDDFIEQTLQSLGMGEQSSEFLAKNKIDYFLCSKDEMEKLTGHNTHGLGILQFDAVTTQHLPHNHELTHLLVNFYLQEAPLYTLPFLQEGLACYYGGRWGRSPEVINYTGYISLDNELCKLEDILTYNDFYYTIGSTEIAYPVSCLFVGYLIEEHGLDNFMKMYRHFSGAANEVLKIDAATIREKISLLCGCGLAWEQIEKEFDKYWKNYKYGGIEPADARPESEPDREVRLDDIIASIREMEGYYLFEIWISEEAKEAMVLWSNQTNNTNYNSYKSRLYTQHLPGQKYAGEFIGLDFSPTEIGLYDYYCDNLLAKFLPLLSPEETVWDDSKRLLTFKISREKMPFDPLSDSDMKIIKK